MKEFRINNYITLRLEGNKTIIYIKDEPFAQCKSLLINITKNSISSYNKLEAIDEVIDWDENSLEIIKNNNHLNNLTHEVEFWGHCSNLQAWAENNYDSRLIHKNLAFPLLKKLFDSGDAQAKKTFKKEIIKRLSSNYPPTILYLGDDDFLEIFTDNDWKNILSDESLKIVKNLVNSLPLIYCHDEVLADYMVNKILKYQNKPNIRKHTKIQICKLFKFGSEEVFVELVCYKFIKFLNKNDIINLFEDPNSQLIKNLDFILKSENKLNCKNLDYIIECIMKFLKYIEKSIEELSIRKYIKKKYIEYSQKSIKMHTQ